MAPSTTSPRASPGRTSSPDRLWIGRLHDPALKAARPVTVSGPILRGYPLANLASAIRRKAIGGGEADGPPSRIVTLPNFASQRARAARNRREDGLATSAATSRLTRRISAVAPSAGRALPPIARERPRFCPQSARERFGRPDRLAGRGTARSGVASRRRHFLTGKPRRRYRVAAAGSSFVGNGASSETLGARG
jgi:hypothetical protein